MAKAGWGNGRDTEGRDKGDEDSVLKASDRSAGKTQSAGTTKGQSEGTSMDRNGWRGGQLAKTPGGELEGEGTASLLAEHSSTTSSPSTTSNNNKDIDSYIYMREYPRMTAFTRLVWANGPCGAPWKTQ